MPTPFLMRSTMLSGLGSSVLATAKDLRISTTLPGRTVAAIASSGNCASMGMPIDAASPFFRASPAVPIVNPAISPVIASPVLFKLISRAAPANIFAFWIRLAFRKLSCCLRRLIADEYWEPDSIARRVINVAPILAAPPAIDPFPEAAELAIIPAPAIAASENISRALSVRVMPPKFCLIDGPAGAPKNSAAFADRSRNGLRRTGIGSKSARETLASRIPCDVWVCPTCADAVSANSANDRP